MLTLFLNGCMFIFDRSHPKLDILIEKDNCKTEISWINFLRVYSRKKCIDRLNENYNHKLYLNRNDWFCQNIVSAYQTSWQKLDQQIIAKAKAENKPLPEDFKTAEEIFAEYPNPCQNDDNFLKQIDEYNTKQKTQ